MIFLLVAVNIESSQLLTEELKLGPVCRYRRLGPIGLTARCREKQLKQFLCFFCFIPFFIVILCVFRCGYYECVQIFCLFVFFKFYLWDVPVWLSELVQVTGWKNLSPKWPVHRDIKSCSLSIRLRDGWLSWPCWLTDSRRLNRKVVTSS